MSTALIKAIGQDTKHDRDLSMIDTKDVKKGCSPASPGRKSGKGSNAWPRAWASVDLPYKKL